MLKDTDKNMEKWLRERLSYCLDFDVPDDMIKYILNLKTIKDFDNYFKSLLNENNEEHCTFLNDCKARLFNNKMGTNTKNPSRNQQQSQQQQQQQQSKKHINESNINFKQNVGVNSKQENPQLQGCKKKTKYVNLYTTDGSIVGETIMLKGRHWCNCQATRHKLINNCLSCGRIVCAQEGSGACLFCGELVCTNEEQKILKESGKKSESLLKSLKERSSGEALKQALEQRDRLLDYDRNSEKRTVVIDDELDYFEENSVWLSERQRAEFERLRQEMHDSKHASRINRKIKIDFAGREVHDDVASDCGYEAKIQDAVAKISANENSAKNKVQSDNQNDKKLLDLNSVDPNIQIDRPLYRPSFEEITKAKNDYNSYDGLERTYNRIQDKELMEMQDMRQCLSLHQPYASLLIAGIKRHEGRVWYTQHRGRLWIASTSKEAHPDEINDMENFYRMHYNDIDIKFPDHYPSGCLLGCVKLDDCLPQEEYRDLYPNGESESPYVLICSQPERLPIVIPIQGQHKIYSLDLKVHNAALKTLMRLKASQAA